MIGRRHPMRRTGILRKPPRATGPGPVARLMVRTRAGGRCEFPMCGASGQDYQHRYERKSGGAGPKSPAAPWINKPANLLYVCRHDHGWVTNNPREAWEMGWVLRSGDGNPIGVPVQTNHDPLPVYLDNRGGWTRLEAVEVEGELDATS